MVAFFASNSWQVCKGCCVLVGNPILIMGLYCDRLGLSRTVIFAWSRDCAGCLTFVLGERAVLHALSCHLELVRDQASHVDLAVTLF